VCAHVSHENADCERWSNRHDNGEVASASQGIRKTMGCWTRSTCGRLIRSFAHRSLIMRQPMSMTAAGHHLLRPLRQAAHWCVGSLRGCLGTSHAVLAVSWSSRYPCVSASAGCTRPSCVLTMPSNLCRAHVSHRRSQEDASSQPHRQGYHPLCCTSAHMHCPHADQILVTMSWPMYTGEGIACPLV
jgi:hypothetical protein